MLTQKNNTLRSVLFIVSFAFTSQAFGEPLPHNLKDVANNPNIHTKKDSSSPENFAQAVKAQILKNIELVKKKKAEFFKKQNSSRQLSPEEISVITTHVSKIAEQLLDDQTKAHAELQEQDQAESLSKPDAQNSSDDYVKNVVRYHWNTTDIVQYARKSKLAARQALLKKLIHIKSSLNTQADHIRQCIYSPKMQPKVVPVIATTDPLFAIGAGATIVGEFILTGATIATGLYVGSGNQNEKNSPIPQAPTSNPEQPQANTTTAASPANAPHTNTTATPSKVTTKETKKAAKAAAKEVKVTTQEPIKKNIVSSPSNIAANAQRDSETAGSHAATMAVKNYHDQKAVDQERRDNLINAGASILAIGCQQYAQEQNRARKEKIIAEDNRKKEEDIQRRMRAECKTHKQIEEDDELRYEQGRQYCIEYQQRRQKAEVEEIQRKKEEKEANKKYKQEQKIKNREEKNKLKESKQLEKKRKRLKKVSIVNSDTLVHDTAPISVPDTEILTTPPSNAFSQTSASSTDDVTNNTAPAENDPFKKKRTVVHLDNLKTHTAHYNIGSQNSPARIYKNTITPSKRRPYRNSTVCDDDNPKTNRPAVNTDSCQSSYSYRNTELHEKPYKNSAEYKDATYKDAQYRNAQYKDAQYKDTEYKDVQYKNAEYREKKKQKLEQRKKLRQNDVNRTSNSGPGKDPDDEDDDEDDYGLIDEIVDVITDTAVDAIVDTISDRVLDWSKVIYEGNPKHNPNSKGNVSKPPYNGKANIKKSVWVKTNPNGLSQRVGIENGKVVIYKEHAPNRYHGYIETNPKKMRQEFKNALERAKLIYPGKNFRIRK